MKIKRASGVKRVLYGTAAAGALLASSVSADEVTGSLQLMSDKVKERTTEENPHVFPYERDQLQLTTSGDKPLPVGSKLKIKVGLSDPSSLLSSPTIEGKSLVSEGDGVYSLDVSGMAPGKLTELVVSLGECLSKQPSLTVTMTYDLLIDGKSVSTVSSKRVVTRSVSAFEIDSSGSAYSVVSDGSKELASTYQSSGDVSTDAGVKRMALTDLRNPVTLTADRLEGVGATDMFVDIDVPDGVSLAIKDTADNVTKSIFSEYRSGNHYHIPKAVFENADGGMYSKIVFNSSELGRKTVAQQGLSSIFDRTVVSDVSVKLSYKDKDNVSKVLATATPVKLFTRVTLSKATDGKIHYAQKNNVTSSVFGYSAVNNGIDGTLSIDSDVVTTLKPLVFDLKDDSVIKNRTVSLMQMFNSVKKVPFVVTDVATGKVLGELVYGSSRTNSLVLPDSVTKISVAPKVPSVINGSVDSRSYMSVSITGESGDAVAIATDMAGKNETSRVVRQVKGSYDDASITSTHTILLDKLTIKGRDEDLERFVPQDSEVGLSASLDLMIAKEVSTGYANKVPINGVTVSFTLPDGLMLKPNDSPNGYDIVKQDGQSYTLRFKNPILNINGERKSGRLSVNVISTLPAKTRVYKIPFTFNFDSKLTPFIVNPTDNVSTFTLVAYTAKELLSTSDIDYAGLKNQTSAILDASHKEAVVNSNLMNMTSSNVAKWESLAYIPQKGIDGSTATAKLTGAITAPKGWKVLYTTDKVSGNREVDAKLNFVETPSDFSRVTAVKYVATAPVNQVSITTFKVPLAVTNEPGAKYVYRTDITTDTASHILSAPVSISAKEAELKTRYLEKDTNKVLSPEEKGKKDKKDIPEYTFVETKVDGNVTTHYYTKELKTRYLEKDTNKVLSPEEKGKKDKKDISDYTFVETKVDGNVTTHYYTRELKTRYLEQGTNNVLSPEEKGKKDKKDIPDYTFVETKVDGNVTTHYYTCLLYTSPSPRDS